MASAARPAWGTRGSRGDTPVRSIQWILGLAVVTVCGVSTVWFLAPGEADRLRREKEELAQQRAELQRSIQRLTGEDRVAEVRVIDQVRAGDMVDGRRVEQTQTTIEFVELDRQQHPLPAQRFVVPDTVLFFDALVIKFDQEHVTAGDALRGKSLALFRRIYGEHQRPIDGFAVDPEGNVPHVFRVNPEAGRFERKLWAQFWSYATDPELAARDGVRVAQGEAVYVPMNKGEVWTLTLQNNGGLNIRLHRKGAIETPGAATLETSQS